MRSLKPESFGLSSRYLLKLLHPDSPIDRQERQRLLEQARTNQHLAADHGRLAELARAAGTDDWEQAVKLHTMFESLCSSEWRHPAELLGDSVPFRGLLSIAEAKLASDGRHSARIREVKSRLEAAERAAAQVPAHTLARTLLELRLSASGLEAALSEVRWRFEQGSSTTDVSSSTRR